MNDAELNARFEQIDGRFKQVDARFEQIDGRFKQVDARFEQIDGRFKQVDDRFKTIEDLIKTEGAATRRHFDVVAEGLSGQIKLLAEGYDSLRTDVTDLKEGQQRLEAGVDRLDLRMLSLESRQIKLERIQKVVLTEVRLLADSSRIRRASRRN